MFKFNSVFAGIQLAIKRKIAVFCNAQLLSVANEVIGGTARATESDG